MHSCDIKQSTPQSAQILDSTHDRNPKYVCDGLAQKETDSAMSPAKIQPETILTVHQRLLHSL